MRCASLSSHRRRCTRDTPMHHGRSRLWRQDWPCAHRQHGFSSAPAVQNRQCRVSSLAPGNEWVEIEWTCHGRSSPCRGAGVPSLIKDHRNALITPSASKPRAFSNTPAVPEGWRLPCSPFCKISTRSSRSAPDACRLPPGTHHRKSSTQTECSYRNYADAPGELPTFWIAIGKSRQTVDRENCKALIYKPYCQGVVALAAALRGVRPRNTGPLRCVGFRLKREGFLRPL